MTKKNKKVYRLTEEGMKEAFQLLEGATPSDLNISPGAAAVALSLLHHHLKSLAKDALNLARMYADAAKLCEGDK